MALAAYTKTSFGDEFHFSVTPAPRVLGGCAGLLLIFLLSLIVGYPASIVVGAVFAPILRWFGFWEAEFISLIISFVGVYYFLVKKLDLRKKNHKKPSEFTVKPDAVQIDGKTILKTDIHRIIVRNAYDNTPRLQLTGSPVSTGAGIGHDIRNALEQISYSVNVEAGGKATQLAGGLDETTAFGLLTEVNRILNIEANS